jgi:hypothetical protein
MRDSAGRTGVRCDFRELIDGHGTLVRAKFLQLDAGRTYLRATPIDPEDTR